MNLLKKGSKGSEVKDLQMLLNSKGNRLTADGDFGAATEKAVRAFQMLEDLPQDGVVGPATLARLTGQAVPTGSIAGPVSKKIILVSAGHSTVPPKDPGACGNNYQEAQEALRLRDAVAAKLRLLGYTVLEDGADGVSEPLTKAIALARRADRAVEIHFNASTNPSATGVEVLAKIKHRDLAHRLCAAVADATGLKPRGGDDGYRPDNSGQHHRLGFVEAGGVILEICFISNPDDMRRYIQNFDRIARNVADVLGS